MTVEQWIGLALAVIIMFAGMVGNVLPGLPGTPLVLLAAVAHRLYFGQASVSIPVLLILVGLTVISLVLDYLGSMIGARKLGATWRGIVGAVLGATIGIFFNVPGIILGSFLGALVLEWMGGREMEDSVRAGVGAVLGLFLGALGKLACSAAMIGLFAVSVVSRSGAKTDVVAAVVSLIGSG